MFSFSSRPAAGAGSSGGGDLAEKVRTRRRPCVDSPPLAWHTGTARRAAPRRAPRPHALPAARTLARHAQPLAPGGCRSRSGSRGCGKRCTGWTGRSEVRAAPCAGGWARGGARGRRRRAVGAGARSVQARQPAPSRCNPAADAHRARAAQPSTHAATLRHARRGQLPAAAPAPPPALPCPAGAHSPRLACRGPARGGEAQARDRAVRQEGPGDCDDAGQERGACRLLVTRGTGWLAGRAGLREAAARPWRGEHAPRSTPAAAAGSRPTPCRAHSWCRARCRVTTSAVLLTHHCTRPTFLLSTLRPTCTHGDVLTAQVKTRKAVERLTASKAQLNSVTMQLQEQYGEDRPQPTALRGAGRAPRASARSSLHLSQRPPRSAPVRRGARGAASPPPTPASPAICALQPYFAPPPPSITAACSRARALPPTPRRTCAHSSRPPHARAAPQACPRWRASWASRRAS